MYNASLQEAKSSQESYLGVACFPGKATGQSAQESARHIHIYVYIETEPLGIWTTRSDRHSTDKGWDEIRDTYRETHRVQLKNMVMNSMFKQIVADGANSKIRKSNK